MTTQKMNNEGDLRNKLVWFMLFRVAVVTVLLGGTLLFNLDDLDAPINVFLFLLVVCTYLLTIFYATLLKAMHTLTPLAYLQVMGDLLVYTGLVYATGVVESPFVFFFFLTIIMAAILLPQNGAYVTAAVSTFLLALITLQQTSELFPDALNIFLLWIHEGESPKPENPSRAFAILGGLSFAVAVLSSYLTRLIRQADISLVEAQEDFQELANLHTNIVESLNSGLMTVTPEGMIRFFNEAAEKMSGKSGKNLRGASLIDIFPGLDPGFKEPTDEMHRRLTFDYESPDGASLCFGCTLSPLANRRGEEVGTIVIFQDLTQLREMESAVLQSEKLAVVGELSAGLAHELRNPLASMSGSIELITKLSTGLGAEEKRLFDIVQREMARLNELIENFLAFARPVPPQIVKMDLVPLLEETLEVFSKETGRQDVNLQREWPRTLPVLADGNQIRQVIWNLLKNAMQAMPEGGRLSVLGWTDFDRRRTVLQVEDTGQGMDDEVKQQLFTPFFTTKVQGTGLGLALVQKIVHAHAGQVRVESRKARGTTFTIDLPLPHGA